jgi:DNA-directed RNA polymerase subunit RPC12/RpoP
MKVGEEINCAHCGKHSFLRKKSIMNGWKKIGDILICSACGQTIEDLTLVADTNKEIIKDSDHSNAKLDKLASFLGAETLEKKNIQADEKTFCRDCKHYIRHPFFNKCSLTNSEVNPMDDCPSYELLSDEDKDVKKQI